MARLPELLILRAPQALGFAVAHVLAGLGRRVVYVPTQPPSQPCLALLPRLPMHLHACLSASARSAVELWRSHNTLHCVESGNPWWQAAVHYSDTAGVTLALRAQRNLPHPDAAPKWQSWCDVSATTTPDSVEVVDPRTLARQLTRRWLRSYLYGAAQDPQRARVVRWLELRADVVEPAMAPELHPLQRSLGLVAWSRHDVTGCQWGMGDQVARQASAPEADASVAHLPWRVWAQSAVLARGSAWWYDACGAVKPAGQAADGAM